jgi:hypothetical protein
MRNEFRTGSTNKLEPPEDNTVTFKNRLTQAYTQAPWRLRTQKGVLFLTGVLLAACVVWVMLTISVEASEAGLQIQQMTYDKQVLARKIADLRTSIAEETSAVRMAERMEDLKFRPAVREDITYVMVENYVGRQTVIKALPPGSELPPLLLKASYTQSLSEWLFEGILSLSNQSGGLAQ